MNHNKTKYQNALVHMKLELLRNGKNSANECYFSEVLSACEYIDVDAAYSYANPSLDEVIVLCAALVEAASSRHDFSVVIQRLVALTQSR